MYDFEVFHFKRYANKATVKKVYRKYYLKFHPDNNSNPRASHVTKILNQAKSYIDDYLYFIYSQVIEKHKSCYDSDME